jgi:hypothetical protein
MKLPRLAISSALLSLAAAVFLCPNCTAQDSSGNQSWSATSPDGAVNPTRTSQTHTEADGRVVDKTAVQTLGPDGRYIPYSDTEKESRRINDTTVQTIERTFGTDPDGHRTLIQERQEESRSLPGGEQKVSRTVSCNQYDGTDARRQRWILSCGTDRAARNEKQRRHDRAQDIHAAVGWNGRLEAQ